MTNVRNKRLLAALCLSLACLGVLAADPAPADDLNRIILRVNNEILTLHDYEKRKTQEVTTILSDSRLSDSERQERLSQLGKALMQQMFQEMLLMSRATQLGVVVSESDVDGAVRRIQEHQGISNEVELLRALASAGMTLEQLRENMRRDLIYNEIVSREVLAKIQPSEEELRAQYRADLEQYRTPEKRRLKEVIVVDSSDASAAERERLAGEIHRALVDGGDFEAVVEPYRTEGLTGGVIDLSWLEKGELETTIEEAAWSLEVGAFSPPVAGRGGWHILHLVDLQESELRSFAEVQNEIYAGERMRRYEKQMQTFMGELERHAFIDENLPEESVGFRSLAADYVPEADELELFQRPELPRVTAEEGEGEGG